MKDNPKIKYGREGRRLETQKQQREAKGQFHPRSLARSVARKQMELNGMEQLNKVHPGTNKSTFAMKWRNVSDQMAR